MKVQNITWVHIAGNPDQLQVSAACFAGQMHIETALKPQKQQLNKRMEGSLTNVYAT